MVWTEAMDVAFMEMAIEEARVAASRGERPFGCVIVGPDLTVLSRAGGSETPIDPTRHSEIEAIRAACGVRDSLLRECTLYSTHEPCLMCIGAINHAKLSRVVWGSRRRNLPDLFRQRKDGARWLLADTTHPPFMRSGVLQRECVALFDGEVAEVQAARKAIHETVEDWRDVGEAGYGFAR